MKENLYDNNMNELDEEKVNYQELLFKYIIHWPWFVWRNMPVSRNSEI